VTELSKTVSSLVLLAAGFCAASMLGPPELAQQLALQLTAQQPGDPLNQLQPVAGATYAGAFSLPVVPLTSEVSAKSPSERPAGTESWAAVDPGPQSLTAPVTLDPGPSAEISAAEPQRTADKPWQWPITNSDQQTVAVQTSATLTGAEFHAPALAWQTPALPKNANEAPPAIQTGPEPYLEHIVADGDTLERIAELYLGDSRRADEIFALNRDHITQPDLLPIGAAIRAPARRVPRILNSSTASAGPLTPAVRPAGDESQLLPRVRLQPPTTGEVVSFGGGGW
jgi:hypothetical protein